MAERTVPPAAGKSEWWYRRSEEEGEEERNEKVAGRAMRLGILKSENDPP